MASMTKAMCVALLAAILAVSLVPQAEAIGCGQVVSNLSGCLPFVTGKGPLGNCCGGIKSLYGLAKTTPDRRDICTCLKSLAGSAIGVNLGKAAGLPKLCGVKVPYMISPSTDCSKVQ